MALSTWWRGDHLPPLTPIANFSAGVTGDAALLAQLAKLDVEEVQSRMRLGHRPYMAWLYGKPAAYGWVATDSAYIGELGVSIILPQGNRYLWDFVTLPAWRGKGVYPRLLQAILAAELAEARRFWIIAAPENRPSAAGIGKAGFTSVAHLSLRREGMPGLIAIEPGDRVHAAAALMRVPLLEAEASQPMALAPCWRCAIDAHAKGQEQIDAACWPVNSKADLVPVCSCT